MIFLIYGGTKPIIEVNDWLYQTKIHIVYIFYKIYQGIPPYFMALSSMNKVWIWYDNTHFVGTQSAKDQNKVEMKRKIDKRCRWKLLT